MTGDVAAWAAVAFACSAIAVGALRRAASRLPLAHPTDRGLHAAPVPRVGGIAIWAGWLPAALLAPPQVPGPWPAWLAAWALVAAVSLADDVRGAGIGVRLGAHALAAAVVAMLLPDATTPALRLLAFVVLAWAPNLYNFMDGSDGLAGTMAAIGFGAYAAGLGLRGDDFASTLALAAACVPFLLVNRPPASMFLGDVGAVPLGFLAAALGIAGVAQGAWPAWFPALVFLPFLLDATLTLARRALAGRRFWEPHREHYYQRLHRMGFGHAGTLAAFSGLALAGAVAAVATLALAPGRGPVVLGLFVAVHAAAFVAIDYHWGRRRSDLR